MAIQLLKHYGSKEAVDALWKATRSDNDDIRRQAWIALTGSGQDKAYARLEALLGSDAPRDRTIAAEVLAGRPEHPSGPLLAASLEKEREFVVARKLATAIALIDYREGADAIAGLLGRETRTSPFQAVDASAASNSLLKLASLPPSTVEILLALASSENEAIRVHTARVLGRTCSGPRVREALMTLLRDPSVHVRDQALASWLALDEGTVDVLVSTYAVETDPDMLKRMRKVILQLYHRWPR